MDARKLDDTSTVDGGVAEDATKRARKAAEQGDDIDKQIENVEMESFEETTPYKNNDITDPDQGVASAKDKSFEVLDNLNRIDTDPLIR